MAHESKGVIYAALAGNAAIAATKLAAALWTGSSAMFSEAIHSAVDTGNEVLLLHGLRRAAKPATAEHPFGYGLELYFWTFIVAVLIFGLGAGVSLYQGIEKIRTPHPIEDVVVNYVVLGLSMVFEGITWWVAFRAFRQQAGGAPLLQSIRRSKDPTVFTVLLEDTAALAGLTIALTCLVLAQMLNLPVLDGVGSVLIGLLLTATAAFLAGESKGLLSGEAVRPGVRDSLREMAAATPGVAEVNEVLTMHFGPADVLVAVSLDFGGTVSADAVEHAVSGLERRMKAAHPEVQRVFVEAQSRHGHLQAQTE